VEISGEESDISDVLRSGEAAGPSLQADREPAMGGIPCAKASR